MNKREFLRTPGLSAGLLAVGGCTDAAHKRGVKASAERPNILFCICDEQSWLHTLISGGKADGIIKTGMPANSRTFEKLPAI